MAKQQQSEKNSLQLMRMMLSQQEAPKLQTAPVQDLGGGIMQGVGNIVSAIQQRRQQQQSAQIMSALLQQEAAQQALDQKNLGDYANSIATQYHLDPRSVSLALMTGNTSLLEKSIEGAQKGQENQQKLYEDQAKFGSAYDAVLQAQGVSPDAIRMNKIDPVHFPLESFTTPDQRLRAQMGAMQAMGMNLPGSAQNGNIIGGQLQGGYAREIIGDPTQLNTGRLSPAQQTQLGMAGIPFVDSTTEHIRQNQAASGDVGLQNSVVSLDRNKVGLQSDQNALNFQPSILQANLTGQNISNSLGGIHLQYAPALYGLQLQNGQQDLQGKLYNNFITGNDIQTGQGLMNGSITPMQGIQLAPGLAALHGQSPEAPLMQALQTQKSIGGNFNKNLQQLAPPPVSPYGYDNRLTLPYDPNAFTRK